MAKLNAIPFRLIFLMTLCVPALTRGSDAEFSLVGGASQIYLDDDGFDEQWGPFFATSFSLAPLENATQFRLGAGLAFAWFNSDVDNEFVSGQADLFLITPEVLLSWRHAVTRTFYLEPGVGLGAVIGALDFLGADWDAGYSVRPFVRAGYQGDDWSAGAELGYRFGSLDISGDEQSINDVTFGVFVAFKL